VVAQRIAQPVIALRRLQSEQCLAHFLEALVVAQQQLDKGQITQNLLILLRP
jgi:hypothetical protein